MSEQEAPKPQDQWQVEDYRANLEIEFDTGSRILHLSARRPVVLANSAQMDLQREAVEQVLRQSGPEPVYVMVHLPRFIIDPGLAPVYASRIVKTIQKYAHAGGIARYGLNMTRVTVKMAYSSILNQEPNLFATRSEAEAYIHGIVAGNRSHSPPGTPAKEDSEEQPADCPSVIPPQY